MALQLRGEAALSAFLETLFQGLSPIVHKGFSLFWGINQELEILQLELSRIQGVLNDAERKRRVDKGVNNWLDDLQDLAYDMDDIIDEMNTEMIRMKVHAKKLSENDLQVGSLFSISWDTYGEVKFKEEIKSKIDEVIKRFSVVAKTAVALGLRREVLEGTSFVRQQTGPLVVRSEVYGRDKDQENVIKLLLAENGSKKNYDIFSIVGTGGIGKTTLAQLVFNDQHFRSNFDGLSWACVSDVFDVAKVTRELFEYYTGNSCSLASLGALQLQLENMLKGEKFFLVLDDVWTTKEWDIMKGPLSQCGKGSKILITTRSKTVARAISRREPYEVGAFDEVHSWKLFREKAFLDEEEEIDERLVDIGKKIVKKCGGFPLAIKVIGAILQDATVNKWESILNSELWESLGSDDEIFPALRLSYHVLPSHLKRCFEYLSLFPTDFKLSTDELVPMWIAEGLIEAEKGRLAEDVGNEYYKDLQNRCLIQMDGRMHDLVHSLACFVSGNFHCRVTKSSQVFTTARRYSFSGAGVEQYDLNSISKAKGIRTLLVFRCKLLPLVDHFSEWKVLRVLDLSKSGLMDLPNSIGDLKSLRYLNLSYNSSICHLPNAICNLYNLQVLLLIGCYSLERMPDGIGDLLNLESMNLSLAPISTLPDSICQLARLEKLWIDYCKNLAHLPEEIGSLTSLRLLSLCGLQVNELPESMCHLHQLQELNISDCKNLAHLPEEIGSLTSLRLLSLGGLQVNELPESMCHLHQLQELIFHCENLGNPSNLHMTRCGKTQLTSPDSISSFCSLQELSNEDEDYSINRVEQPQHIGEAALSALFQTLLQGLSPIFLEGLSLISGVNQDQLERLKDDLSRIQVVLNDAERRRRTDKRVSNWLDDLRDLAYDMEDIIDEVNTERIRMEVHAKKHSENYLQAGSLFPIVMDKSIAILHEFKFKEEIKSKIDEVIKRFSMVAKTADAFGLRRQVLVGTSYKYVSRIQDQLERLKDDLSRIQDVLKDAERRRRTDKRVSNWLDDLLDLAYDMADIIDEVNIERIRMEVHSKRHSENYLQAGSLFPIVMDKSIAILHEFKFKEEIKSKIDEVIKRFSMVAKTVDAFGLRRQVLEGTSFVRQQTGPLVVRSEVYGRDKDQENVIKLLLAENGSKKNYDIFSIVGTGGIGKTTLAQLVLNDQHFRSNFDGLSWACVSDVFDVAKVTRELFEYYTGNSCSLASLGALQLQLENMLKGEKFFLVLDDVWTTKEWDIMKGPLSQCGKGSKILITTRSKTVARAISRREPYEVGALDEVHSWKLFREKAFLDGEEKIDERLVDIGKKIVKKCGGFPLAIKVIGAILQDATVNKWESILNSELWESLGSDDEIFPALRLSYHVLPSHLKRCFEYLSLFPTDFKLSTDELVPMWIAEGLIEAEKGRLAEDVGNEYYKDLQNRCLIQMDGRMHDLVHSLACFVSGNFHCQVTKSSQVFTTARRYSFSGAGVEQYDLNSISKAKGIRTLLVFRCKLLPLVDHFSEWKFLRVLDLSKSGLMDLPNSIGDLRSLRYLNLSYNWSICHLPNAICNLYNLQVLLLIGCYSLERMPDGIGDLLNLESMNLSRAPISTLPDSICQLACLEKLWIDYCKNLAHLPEEIGSLTSLRLLSLCGLQVNELPESMCQLHQLQELDISDCKNLVHLPNDLGNLCNLRILRCGGTQLTLPDSISSICNLQELDFPNDTITELPRHIGRLTNIQSLVVYPVGKDEGRGIRELRYLNKIKGPLAIVNLDNISSVEEATMADLKSKKYVDELVLKWSDIPIIGELSDIERDKELEVEILQALQPNATSLTRLSLENYFGDRFPRWILDGGQLPSLKILDLNSLNNINIIDIKLPSLEHLSVTNCPNLKEISIVAFNPPQLAALQELTIIDCEQLTSLGIESSALPNLRNLSIHHCGKLESLFKDGRLPFTLNHLSCVYCHHLNFITDDQGMQDLNSLVHLHVDYSKKMEMELQAGRLPANLKRLTMYGRTDIISMPPSCFCNVASSLESLNISDFPNLTSLPNSLHDMGSLQTFTLFMCPQLVSFPNEGLPPLLRYLSIWGCDKLLFLPTNIYNLQRLCRIWVEGCSLLQARVDDQLPPNLKYLTIRRCPKLENQLREEDRKDWLRLMRTF